MVTPDNPFATPQATLGVPGEQQGYDKTALFDSKGRMGRVDYMLYSTGINLLAGIVSGILAFILSMISPVLASLTSMCVVIACFFATIVFTIKRLHDINQNGLLCLLFIVPLVNLFFFMALTFMAGTPGANNFGLPPHPPSTLKIWLVIVLSILFLLLLVLGIILAIPSLGRLPI